MKRVLMACAVAVAALALTACQTAPVKEPTAAPVASKTTVDLMLEVRSKELELARTDQMAWLKFAAESGSDMVKGFIMGRAGAGAGTDQGGSASQSIMRAQAQADNTALRREEMAYANSWDKRLLPYVGLGLEFARFDRQLGFQRWSIGENNAQSRYTFDSLRGAQQDAYGFASTAYGQGSAATLGGVSAGASAAAAGAASVQPAAEPATLPE